MQLAIAVAAGWSDAVAAMRSQLVMTCIRTLRHWQTLSGACMRTNVARGCAVGTAGNVLLPQRPILLSGIPGCVPLLDASVTLVNAEGTFLFGQYPECGV